MLISHQVNTLNNIYTVYQPIFDLYTGKVFANEALTRSTDTRFKDPVDMINHYIKDSAVHIMDTSCHEKSLELLEPQDYHQNIFLNIECITMLSDEHLEKLNELLEQSGVPRENVVLEICERHYDMDIETLSECFDKYIDAGYKLALDDIDVSTVGMSTQLISKCSFIKLSINSIKGIDKDDSKKALLKAITMFAKFMDIKIVAEGVETKEELQCLIELNIHLAQGYLLGKPDRIATKNDVTINQVITSLNKKKYCTIEDNLGYSFVGQIMEQRPALIHNIKCKEVVDFFKNSKFDSLCFLDSDNQIVGFINQNDLFNYFSTQYGYALHGDKPVNTVYNKTPLIVNYHSSIKEVLETAMGRPEKNIYDDVIVANNDKYLGIASMQQVITKYNEIDTMNATQLNPLTSLPGNNIINNNINKYLNNGETILFVYVDLSEFKVYNDFYGFECGDIVLKKTANLLSDRFDCVPYDSFVGHIGGDDFVCMCELGGMKGKKIGIVHSLLDGIINDFERYKVNFYNENDYKKGYIETANRLGKYGKCRLININIACYLGRLDCFKTLEEIAEYMASIKRQSKQRDHSNYIIKYSKNNNIVDVSFI